jgi:hypothetical protein
MAEYVNTTMITVNKKNYIMLDGKALEVHGFDGDQWKVPIDFGDSRCDVGMVGSCSPKKIEELLVNGTYLLYTRSGFNNDEHAQKLYCMCKHDNIFETKYMKIIHYTEEVIPYICPNTKRQTGSYTTCKFNMLCPDGHYQGPYSLMGQFIDDFDFSSLFECKPRKLKFHRTYCRTTQTTLNIVEEPNDESIEKMNNVITEIDLFPPGVLNDEGGKLYLQNKAEFENLK